MRLLSLTTDEEFTLTTFTDEESLPPYAILSHTWVEGEEVIYDELIAGIGKHKAGYDKLRFCGERASQDGLQYFWVDTCCIDKRNNTELMSAINSMFRWYQRSTRCYVFLVDVGLPDDDLEPPHRLIMKGDALRKSRWFTRGWTLQELIAPASVEFFSNSCERLGDRISLEQEISEITDLPVGVLRGQSLADFSIDERMSWVASRQTTVKEDKAYCLFGMLGVFLPIIYGEGMQNAFRRLRKELDSSIDRTKSEMACLQSFYTSDYEAHRKRNPDRISGTCEWFLHHPKYLSWRQPDESAFLWVSADPGCGKSVLASFLVQELSNTGSEDTPPGDVCFFFFKNDNSEQKTAVHALCAILHQLFVAQPTLVRYAIPDFEKKGAKLMKEFDSMWSILVAAATNSESKILFCVLDGLDECEELTRNMLVESLVKFYSKPVEQKSKSSLKIIVTSRPYFGISESFRILPEIRLKMEDEIDISDDIELVVRARLKSFALKRPYLDSERIETIERKLIAKADRTFLWVSLVLGMLEKSIEGSEQEFIDIIQTLSYELEAIFEEILRRSPNHEKAKKILHIIVGSTRPLTLTEMNIALAIRLDDKSIDDLAPRMLPDPADSIKEICGLFVRVIDSKLYLIHETAREFLIRGVESVNVVPGSWNHSLHTTKSNLILATICIAYLNFTTFKYHPLVLDHDQPYPEQRSVMKTYIKKHDLLEYAARNCAVHFRKSNEDETLQAAWRRLFRRGSRRFDTWYSIYKDWQRESPKQPTSVILGSYFGLPKLVQSRLHQGSAIHRTDDSGMTALHWAIEAAQINLVQLLLDEGADIAAIDDNLETALHKAARKGEDAIVRLLIQHDADIDARDHENCTPLHFAAAKGHEIIMNLLIEHGSDIHATDDECQSMLHHATHSKNSKILEILLDLGLEVESFNKDHVSVLHEAVMYDCYSWEGEEMVRLLLRRGANPQTTETGGGRPLDEAALHGREQVVRLLLAYGASLNTADPEGQTALHHAARGGQFVIVALLLQMGADVRAMSNWGTPLHLSAMGRTDFIGLGPNSCKHEAVVRILLQNGAEVDSKEDTGSTPLMFAAKAGHVESINLLLEWYADIDMQNNDGNAPIHWAAADGREEAVQVLILRGAELNAVNAAGESALHWAAGGDFTAVVKLLLATEGTDPDLKNAEERAPLSYAASSGHHAIVELLLATGKVDLDMLDEYGRTPFSWAAEGGHKEVIELLLATGKVDLDNSDEDRRTPLFWAAEGGHIDVIELLLASNKIDLDTRNIYGQTPLSVASKGGHDDVVNLLISTGKVDTDARDKNGQTPISAAAEEGHEEVVKLLLATGKVDPDSRDERGRTPLSWAAHRGHEEVIELLLATNKVDLGSKDDWGHTALSSAESKGHNVVASLLRSRMSVVIAED